MMNEQRTRIVSGTVKLLRCDKCGASFPTFVFVGEDDSDTAGLCTASVCGRQEVVLAEAEPSEWNDFDKNGSASIEHRLRTQIGEDRLKIIRLLRVEKAASVSAQGMSFQDFKKAYKPPTLIYSCACCDGESRVVSEMSIEEFERTGGRLVPIGRLVLNT
jgi:hypothetical protein